MEQFSTDLLSFSATPPVQGIVRARDNDGIDPKSNDAYEVWVNRLTQIFKANAENKQFYQQIRYLNEDGDEMVRVDFRDGKSALISGADGLANKATSSSFTEARELKAGEVAVSPLNLNKEGEQVEAPHVPVIRFSTPIYDQDNRFRGAVVSNVYANSFTSRLTTDQGEIFLSNEDGAYIIHPDSAKTFGSQLDTGFNFEADFSVAHDALRRSGAESVSLIDSSRGEVVALQTVAFDPRVPERHWVLTRTIPEGEILGPIRTLGFLILGIGLAITALIIPLVIWQARSITAPIIKVGDRADDMAKQALPSLARVARAVASGDLSQKAEIRTTRAQVSSRDEIGSMAKSFNAIVDEVEATGNSINEMVDNLSQLIGQMGNTANTLSTASNQIAESAQQAGQATQGIAATSQQVARGAEEQTVGSQEIGNSMGQLSSAIDQVAQGSQQQAASIEEASGIVSQVSTATSDVAGSAQEAADGARRANEAAQSGAEMVNKTVKGIGRIKSAVDDVSTKVLELGEQSAEIGKIVMVIEDIAVQTNLLALNAAIEAARAGEQGRGFAVVADEVRKLAERVTGATKEISTLIDAVQQGVVGSVKATEDGAREVSEGVQLAEAAGDTLKEIIDSVGAVAAQIEQISAAAEQVSASSDEMVRTIDSVSSIVEQNSASTQQMAASSSEVSQAVANISRVVNENSASIQDMSASSQEMSAQVEEVVASSRSLDEMAQDLQTAVGAFRLK